MGIEFIRNASGKPYSKRWARGIDRTKTPTLMDVSISEESRTLTAKLTAKGAACRAPRCWFSPRGRSWSCSTAFGRWLVSPTCHPLCGPAVDAREGMAPAVVERVGILGATAEIKLK